ELAKKNEELIRSYQQSELIFAELSDKLPGIVLDGKYALDKKIGEGGFGTIYRGTNLALNRQVAVKLFRPSVGGLTLDEVEKFRIEGVSAARISHPNAVTVLDFCISRMGVPYLVMELLNGHSLQQELNEKGWLSQERCGEILFPICDVLSTAHSAGV